MLEDRLTPLLEVDDVVQRYRTGSGEIGPLVLDHVSLKLTSGEIVGLLGRSGCGKSSLLRIVAGLASPTEGKVIYGSEPVTGPVDGLAMVFQSFALFPWLTVLANVEIGLRAKRSTSSGSTASNRRSRRSSRAACASASASPGRWWSTRRSC
jgi:NitT/TauT family transport system ATP-binding protein